MHALSRSVQMQPSARTTSIPRLKLYSGNARLVLWSILRSDPVAMLSCLADVLASLRDVGVATFDCSPTPGTSRDNTCMLRREKQRKNAPRNKVVTTMDCLNVMHERSIGRDGLKNRLYVVSNVCSPYVLVTQH